MRTITYRWACSIPLDNKVVLTGGIFTLTTVFLYNKEGWVEDLAPLTQERYGHACTNFLSASGDRVS